MRFSACEALPATHHRECPRLLMTALGAWNDRVNESSNRLFIEGPRRVFTHGTATQDRGIDVHGLPFSEGVVPYQTNEDMN